MVEEGWRGGMEEIIMVRGKDKGGIEEEFDKEKEVEMVLEEKGKNDLLEGVEYWRDLGNMF